MQNPDDSFKIQYLNFKYEIQNSEFDIQYQNKKSNQSDKNLYLSNIKLF